MRTTAPYRFTDPDTSRAAAEKVTPKVAPTRARVYAILSDAGPDGLTHEQIIEEHRRREALIGYPSASVSSLRTRCSELVRDREVERVPDKVGRSAAGNASVRWRVANVYGSWTDDHGRGAV